MHLDRVARGAGDRPRRWPPRAAPSALRRLDFPALGGPCDDDLYAGRARARAAWPCDDLGRERRRAPARSPRAPARAVPLSASTSSVKSIAVSAFRRRRDQRRAPRRRRIADHAGQLPLRLAALHLRLGVDEIGETLDLGEVELAVEEGAAGELAGLGERSTPAVRCEHIAAPWRRPPGCRAGAVRRRPRRARSSLPRTPGRARDRGSRRSPGRAAAPTSRRAARAHARPARPAPCALGGRIS